MFGWLTKGAKAVAAGRTGASLGITSPYTPGAVVRIGRFAYSVSIGWIAVVWYSGYVNERTTGGGPQLIIPGTKKATGSPDRPNPTANFSTLAAGGASVSDRPGGKSTKVPGKGPFPGAVGGRLDQGFDLTGENFNAPDRSQIIYAATRVTGWGGGGFVAGKLLAGPKRGKVWYMAEGLIPTVRVGEVVTQFQQVARAANNPYNNTRGNIEAGWANPSSPTQPLAQISSNKAAVAWDFYNYVRSLGAPNASQTGNAGLP